MTTIGTRLRQRRLKLGLMQKDIAAAANVSKAAISKWESNGGTAMSAVVALRICQRLNVTPAWLIFGSRPSGEIDSSIRLSDQVRDVAERINSLPSQLQDAITQLIDVIRN